MIACYLLVYKLESSAPSGFSLQGDPHYLYVVTRSVNDQLQRS